MSDIIKNTIKEQESGFQNGIWSNDRSRNEKVDNRIAVLQQLNGLFFDEIPSNYTSPCRSRQGSNDFVFSEQRQKSPSTSLIGGTMKEVTALQI